MSSGEPIKWRYGAKLTRSNAWMWPRGLWEYDLEKAKAAARRTFPHSGTVGVEPLPPASGPRWLHDHDKGWRVEETPAPSAPAPVVEQWWQRD